MRAIMKEHKRMRKGKQRTVIMQELADESDNNEDWEENMRSDPINSDE